IIHRFLHGDYPAVGEDTVTCRDLHPHNTHPLFNRPGQKLLNEGIMMLVCRVDGNQYIVKREPLIQGIEYIRSLVSGKTNETDHLFITGFYHCLQYPVISRDPVKGLHLRHFYIMYLPEVKMVSVELPERLLQQPH